MKRSLNFREFLIQQLSYLWYVEENDNDIEKLCKHNHLPTRH